jgi:hypothetical protein
VPRIYYSVEAGGACYGSSLVRVEADAAVARAAVRGMRMAVVERTARPDVVGWLTPCHESGHARKRR